MRYIVYTVMGNSALCESMGFLSVDDLCAVINSSSDVFITHNSQDFDYQKSVNITHLVKLLDGGSDIGNSKLVARNTILVKLLEAGVQAHLHAGIPVGNYQLDQLFPRDTVESYLKARTELTRSIFDVVSKLPMFDEHMEFYLGSITQLDRMLIKMSKVPIGTTDGDIHIAMSPAATRLGRLSVTKGVNILNIKKRERVKFVSRFKGGKLVQYDFKAIDFRVALFDAGYADVAGKEDLYQQIKEMTYLPMRRDNVKTLALGRLYGMAITTAAKKFGVPQSRVQEYITTFNSTFPEISARRKALEREFIETGGIIVNWFGRPVHVEQQRNAYQNYIASNTADICALAYRKVYNHLINDEDRNIILLLHDAIIVDQAPDTQQDDITEIMRNVVSDLGKFHVSATSGKDLKEATE